MAIPLPKPLGFQPGDELKLAFAFDSDRLPTPWLPVLGPRAPPVPLLDVQLTRTGGFVTAVQAATVPVPEAYLRLHQELLQEFRNDSHWPKHVLARYHWREVSEEDADAGQYALTLGGLLLATAALASAALSQGAPLTALLAGPLAEPDDAPMPLRKAE